jgi:hypothetical protein
MYRICGVPAAMEIEEAYSPFGRGLTIGSWRPETGQTEGRLGRRITVPSTLRRSRDRPVAEVVSQDLVITDGKVEAYRAKVKVSFKYEGHH